MSNQRLVPLNVVALPTAPSIDRVGDLYYDTSDGNLYVSNGDVWVSLGGSFGPYGSAQFDSDFSDKSTDDLAEGEQNLFFTAQRAVASTAGVYDPAGSAASAEAAALLYTDTQLSNFTSLPSQSGYAGFFLSTDGATASWKGVPGVGNIDGGLPSTNYTSVAPVDGGGV